MSSACGEAGEGTSFSCGGGGKGDVIGLRGRGGKGDVIGLPEPRGKGTS